MKKPVKIGVDASTRDVLRGLKKGGDTFDDVVRRLMKGKEIAEKYIYRPDDWESYQEELLNIEEVEV